MLNSSDLENDVKVRELVRCLDAIDLEITKLIKTKIIKGKNKKGFMSFSFANENVKLDSILIDEATFKALCLKDEKWKTTSHVYCTRYPNLGPRTTKVFRLCVDCDPIDNNSAATNGIGLQGLRSLLEEYNIKTDEPRINGIYFNPENLKNDLQGDADGDLVYVGRFKHGSPAFSSVSTEVLPSDVNEDSLNLLISKSRPSLREENIPSYIDRYSDTPMIGPATYAIRLAAFNAARQYAGEVQPMNKGWQEVADWAIDLIEFVMDIRKGEFTKRQIELVMRQITKITRTIRSLQIKGDWFACTVTSGSISNIEGFIRDFKDLQSYADYIQGKEMNDNLL